MNAIRESHWAAVFTTVVLVLTLCGLHVMLEHRFFYWDDVQHTFAPVFYSIGERLRSGDWPTVTLLVWQGGFLAGEGLYQLFNPVSLAIFSILPSIDDIALGMTLHATSWLLIAALGAQALAARLGASPSWSVLAGVSYALSPFLLYWLAASWVNGAVGFAALPWALVFLAAPRIGPGALAGLVVATYLTGVSGWIHAMLALALFGAARVLMPDEEFSLRARVIAAGALAAGAFFAAPQLLSTIAAVSSSVRPSGISNNGIVTSELTGLLLPFWPPYVSPTRWFSDNGWGPPIYYAAWFVLPGILACRGQWAAIMRRHGWLIVPSVILAIATLGPDQLGPTRWPLRFYPASILGLLVVSATVLTSTERQLTQKGRGVLGTVAAIYILAVIVTWQQHPDRLVILAVIAMICGWLSAVALGVTGPRDAGRKRLVLAIGTVTLLAWMAGEHPLNAAFEDYFGPQHRTDVERAGVVFPGSVVQVYSHLDNTSRSTISIDPLTGQPRRFSDRRTGSMESRWLPSGNMPMWRGERQLNGYSPVELLSVKTLICGQSIFGWTCDGPAATLLATERKTGQRMIDLLRVDAVLVSTRMTESLERFETLGWPVENPSPYVRVFRRPAPSTLPGTVSYVSPGARVVSAQAVMDDEESLTIERAERFEGGWLVLARAAYPGHVAWIDGEPVPIKALNGVLVGVPLPAGSGSIHIDVRHELPFPMAWRAAVLFATVLLAACLWFSARTKWPASQVTSGGPRSPGES